MMWVRSVAVVWAGLAMGMARGALAGQYVDPSGFSFTYPEGWVVVSGAGNLNTAALPPAAQDWVRRNQSSLSNIEDVAPSPQH